MCDTRERSTYDDTPVPEHTTRRRSRRSNLTTWAGTPSADRRTGPRRGPTRAGDSGSRGQARRPRRVRRVVHVDAHAEGVAARQALRPRPRFDSARPGGADTRGSASGRGAHMLDDELVSTTGTTAPEADAAGTRGPTAQEARAQDHQEGRPGSSPQRHRRQPPRRPPTGDASAEAGRTAQEEGAAEEEARPPEQGPAPRPRRGLPHRRRARRRPSAVDDSEPPRPVRAAVASRPSRRPTTRARPRARPRRTSAAEATALPEGGRLRRRHRGVVQGARAHDHVAAAAYRQVRAPEEPRAVTREEASTATADTTEATAGDESAAGRATRRATTTARAARADAAAAAAAAAARVGATKRPTASPSPTTDRRSRPPTRRSPPSRPARAAVAAGAGPARTAASPATTPTRPPRGSARPAPRGRDHRRLRLHPARGQEAAPPRGPGGRPAPGTHRQRGGVPGPPRVGRPGDGGPPARRPHPDRRARGQGPRRALRRPRVPDLADRQRLPRPRAERPAVDGGGLRRHRQGPQRRPLRR